MTKIRWTTDWTDTADDDFREPDQIRLGRLRVDDRHVILVEQRRFLREGCDPDDRPPEATHVEVAGELRPLHPTDAMPEPTPEQLAEADELDAKDRRHQQDARDSWERSDTDGFLSQWASGINGREAAARARLLRQGKVATFPALFDLDGNRVRAKRVDTRYGTRWLVLDAQDNAVSWLAFRPARIQTLAAKGYVEGTERAPAWAGVTCPKNGPQTGLAGAASAYVATYRTDGGYPDHAIPANS